MGGSNLWAQVMIMGLTMFFSVFFVLALLLQDITYGIVDPRIRVSGEED